MSHGGPPTAPVGALPWPPARPPRPSALSRGALLAGPSSCLRRTRAASGPRSTVPFMYAITIPEPGGPEALVWDEVPDPVAGEGEVLVEVVAGAVNRADILQRQGFYHPPSGSSPYPGLECSGRIAEVGPGVSGWAVGDEVCALLTGGGYAEKVAVPAGQLLPVPDGLTVDRAAALPRSSARSGRTSS